MQESCAPDAHTVCLCCDLCRGTNLILSGAYSDFSPNWYADVGQSLQLLIIINAVVTGEGSGPQLPLQAQ